MVQKLKDPRVLDFSPLCSFEKENKVKFLTAHPEFSYQQQFLRDMPGEVWTLFGK